ncbi:alpha-amylase/alpha-mannosidase (GH57 family) [Sulfuritortus calidifontis]|uniref:Alpha-amylase/alpha-mannosidase (GH57 family) n=1 Tax=Sulfuritortus calidifontis TaxID=1914471 RepID=A0A4R3K0C6_9PROT|nr:glycoside hydrolase family 57 protein [Sulfuritortus calidifontis]TCS73036.1 alpha-amylase/alpha-mannosidase (GH57 family) [Sulfuritortus calidifontis]
MLHLILCWHFHQPDYRTESGDYRLPWTYLHALKDYSDMAAHLEAAPDVRAVVNFVPSLVEQLDDYASQFASGQPRDRLLAWLIEPELDRLDEAAKAELIAACFRLNYPTMVEPFPAYRLLHEMYERLKTEPASLNYLSGQYLADLVTWYHLAWTGESVRRDQPLVLALMQKAQGFSLADRRTLFRLIGEVIAGLIPRYRALADRGQVELSTTPHSHPMAPLLIDFAAAREARPDSDLPTCPAYPGGEERVRAHVQAAFDCHRSHFGRRPEGFWPAEGGLSEPALRLFAEEGVRWVASGEGVLRHSLQASGMDLGRKSAWAYRPYRLPGIGTYCFFRDDTLSDLIGFEYKGWWAADAVRHFLHALEAVHHEAAGAETVVTVILDGENAWEYYPYNGFYFLAELYKALADHPDIRTSTFSEYLELKENGVGDLSRLTAGSWVYGDFSTWMGDAAKNRAWDLLCAAKQAYDRAMCGGGLSPRARAAAEKMLKSCESSDWFWWFGDYNPAESVRAFDQLYRMKLRQLYQLLGQPVPAALDTPISGGGGPAESGGVMRRGQG